MNALLSRSTLMPSPSTLSDLFRIEFPPLDVDGVAGGRSSRTRTREAGGGSATVAAAPSRFTPATGETIVVELVVALWVAVGVVVVAVDVALVVVLTVVGGFSRRAQHMGVAKPTISSAKT